MSVQDSFCEFSKNDGDKNIIIDKNVSRILLEIDRKCIKPTICFLKSIPLGFVPIGVLPKTPILESNSKNFSEYSKNEVSGGVYKKDDNNFNNSGKNNANLDNNINTNYLYSTITTDEGMKRLREGSLSLNSDFTESCSNQGGPNSVKNTFEMENQFFPEGGIYYSIFKGLNDGNELNTNYTLLLSSLGMSSFLCRSSSSISNNNISTNREHDNTNGFKEGLEKKRRITEETPVTGSKMGSFGGFENFKDNSDDFNAVISSEQILNICRLGGINNENIWTALFCSFYEDKDGNQRKKYSMPHFLSNKIIIESYSNVMRFSEPLCNSIQIYIYCRDIIKNYCSEVIGPRILLQANLFTIWNNSIKDLIVNKGGNKIFYELFGGENLLRHDEKLGEIKSGYAHLYQLYSNLVSGNLPSLLFLRIFEEEFAKFSVLVHLFTRIFGYLDRNNCHVFSSPNLTATSLLYFYKYVFFPFSVSFSAAILNIITIERDYFMKKSLRSLFTYKVYDENVFSSLQRRGEPCLGFISDLRGACSKCMVETHFSVNFDSLSDTKMEKLAGRSYRSILYNVVNNIIYVMNNNTHNNISLKRTNTFDFDSDSAFVYPEKRVANAERGFLGRNKSDDSGGGIEYNSADRIDIGTTEISNSTSIDAGLNFGKSKNNNTGEKIVDDFNDCGSKVEKIITNLNKISRTIDSNKIGLEESSDSTSGLFWFISEETDLNIYKTTVEDPILKSIIFYYTSRLDGIFDVLDLKQCCILINWILVHEERRLIGIFPKTSYSKSLKILEDVLFQFFSKKILNSNSRCLNNFIYIDEKNNLNLNNNVFDSNNFVKDSLSTYINNDNYCALKLFYILVFKDSAKQSSFKILNDLLNSVQKNASVYEKLKFPLKDISFEVLKNNLNLANIFGLGCLVNGENNKKDNILDYFSDRLPSMVYFVYVIYESILEDVLKAMKLEVFNLNSGIKTDNMRLSDRFKSIQIVLSILNKYRKFTKYSFLNDNTICKFIFKGIYDGLIIYLQKNISKNHFSCLFTLSFWINSFIDNRILQIYSFISLFQDKNNINLLDEKLELYRKQQLHLFIPSFLGSDNSFAPGTSEFGKYTGTFQSFNSKEYFLKFRAFSLDWIGKLFDKYASFICDYFNSVKNDSFDLLNSLESYIAITELELFMNNIISGIILLKILPNSEIVISHYKDRLCKRLLAINCLGNNRLLYPARNLTSMLICISMEYFFLSFMDSNPDSVNLIFGSEFNSAFSLSNYNEERDELESGFKREANSRSSNDNNSRNNVDLNSTNEYKNTSLKSLDYLLDDCVISLFSNSLSTGCFNAFITCDFNWRNNNKFVNMDLSINIMKNTNEFESSNLKVNSENPSIRSSETPYLHSNQYFDVEFKNLSGNQGKSNNLDNNYSFDSRLNYSNINLPEKIKLELENIENSYSKIYPHRKLTWVLDTGFVILSCIGFNVYNDISLKEKNDQFKKVEILTSISTALVLIYIGESKDGKMRLFDLIKGTKLPVLDVIRVLLSFIIPGQNFLRIEGVPSSQINMDKIKDWKNWLHPNKIISLGDIVLNNNCLFKKSSSLIFCPKLLPIEFFIKYNVDFERSSIINRWIMFNIEYFKKSVPFFDDNIESRKIQNSTGFLIRNDYFLKYSDLVEGINFPTLNSKVYRINYPWNIDIYLDDDKYEYFSNCFSEIIGSDDIFYSLYNVPPRVEKNIEKVTSDSESVVSGIYVYKDNHNIIIEEDNDKKKTEILCNDKRIIFGNINNAGLLYSSCSYSGLKDLNKSFRNQLENTNSEVSKGDVKSLLENNGSGNAIDSENANSVSNDNNSNVNNNLNRDQSISNTSSTLVVVGKVVYPLVENGSNNKKRANATSSSESEFVDSEKSQLPHNLTHYSSSSSFSSSSLSSSFLSSSSFIEDGEFYLCSKRQKFSGCFTGIIEIVCKLESIIVRLLKRNKSNKYSEIINYIHSNWSPNISDIPTTEYIDKALIKLIKREFITLNCNHKNREVCSCESNLQRILNDNTELNHNFFEKESTFNYVP
ncbi:hypothetical protein RS030_162442 [Cryptosporidium xiaoi]|uniref:Cullin family profile domain-containing protein n=1 Tax=Cryptosporidium xiaoi TaxID=659607 RepID=A0AAV9Y083_9CRYT